MIEKQKLRNIGTKIIGTLGIPFAFAIILLTVCILNGRMFLTNGQLIANFFSYAAIVMLTTFALSINLGSGRFDFSIGSIATLSAVIGAKVTYAMLGGGTGSAVMMCVVCALAGAVLGMLSGVLYVLLKLPPIITSLGVTLIYEGVCFVLTGGSYIRSELGNDSILTIRTSWEAPLVLMIAVFLVIYYIFDRTKFGYEYKALKEGQKVSVNIGIREIPNAVICYMICGALMGLVGFIQAARNTNINAGVLNFGSISIMFIAFLPMFIGGFIGRYSNDKLGYALAALCMSLLNSMFGVMTDILNSSAQSIITAALLVLFLIFLNNEQTCKDIATGRIFIRLIQAKKSKEQSERG